MDTNNGLGSLAKSCFFAGRICKCFSFFGARVRAWDRPELIEPLKRAGELAVEAGFVTAQVVEGMGLVGQGAVRESRAGWFVLSLVGGGLLAHFVVQRGFFHDPEAHLTPAAHDHVLDQSEFDGIFRLEQFEKRGLEGVEAFGAFSVDGDSVGEEAVLQVALRGCEFPLRRDRPSGSGAVAASGFRAEFRWHFRLGVYMGRLGFIGEVIEFIEKSGCDSPAGAKRQFSHG
jgi:hypothetical protein